MSIPESIYQRLYDAFIEGDEDEAEAVTVEALAAEVDPLEIINKVMIPALTEVGRRFQSGEFFLPELMMAGEAAEAVSQHLEAAIAASGQTTQAVGVVVAGTVQGDVHDIGKNIVATMLRAHGFEVVDLGRNVSPSAFVDAAKQSKADVVALSSLMTTTRPAVLSTVNLFRELGLEDTYKIVIGGGSVTEDWANEIGAGYAPDAAGAVELCKQLLGKQSS
jgi:methylmalonyl-CoA mutase cobalamin-binding domain/chain